MNLLNCYILMLPKVTEKSKHHNLILKRTKYRYVKYTYFKYKPVPVFTTNELKINSPSIIYICISVLVM